MELTNEFRVPVPVDVTWEVLTDVEGIAPCMPGAQLQEIEGDEYRGTVKVKVGPITAQYKGVATWKEQDRDNNRLVLEASGRDTRGQGNASALVTVNMTEDGGSTNVVVSTDLTITGKVAQFGRGVLGDVSSKLIDQFVECLEGKIESGEVGAVTANEAVPETDAAADTDTDTDAAEPASSNGATPTTEAPKVRKIDAPEAAPVDLMGTAGAPVAKRALPVIVVVVLLLLFLRKRKNG